MSKIKRLLIIGTGGQGKVALDCALAVNEYDSVIFLTNDLFCIELAGYPVFHEQETDMVGIREKFDEFIVAIGDNSVRLDKFNRLIKDGFTPATLIHPRAAVSPFARIGLGTVVLANATVGPFAVVGNACIINTSCVVEHDCVLFDAVHISPDAALGGKVSVGEKSWVCIGASVADKVQIGANSVIGAGAVVLNHIPENVLAVGVPAVIKKYYVKDR